MSNPVRRRACLAALGAVGLAGCSSLFVPSSITLSEADLQALLARRFPMQRSVLDAFDLQLDEPRLRLDPQARRLSTELALRGSERRSGRSLQGQLTLDYALRFEPADASLRLVSPRVARIDLGTGQGNSLRLNETTQRLAGSLIERALDDLVLYRVPPERLDRLRSLGFRPGTLEVTASGVEITIERLP